jgi:hypothetical protein
MHKYIFYLLFPSSSLFWLSLLSTNDTVKLSNFNKFSNRTESNRTELSWTNSILSRRTVPELLRIFWLFLCFFFKKLGSVRSNRIGQFNIIQYLHDLNASYSVNFEVRFDRTEPNFLKKKPKIIKKFERGSPWRIRFGSLRQTLNLR